MCKKIIEDKSNTFFSLLILTKTSASHMTSHGVTIKAYNFHGDLHFICAGHINGDLEIPKISV